MSKKYVVVFVLAMFVLVIMSGGCGGGSSSSAPGRTEDTPIDNPVDNPYGVVLEDVLLPEAEVKMAVNWNDTPYELQLRNLGNGVVGDFELQNSSSDLPFKVEMSYGTTGISASFTDKEHDDIYFFFVVDAQKGTYHISLSGVLEDIWSRYDGINSFMVNGVEFFDELEYEDDYGDLEQEIPARYSLGDVFEEEGVFSINFNMDGRFYHYTWRKVRESLDYVSIDDYQENELSVAEMVISKEGFDCLFVNENNGKWAIVSFNVDKSSYRIISNTENIEVNRFSVNGEDETERTTLVSSNSSILGAVLLNGATVKFVTEIKGEEVELGFVNRGNEFVCLLNTSSREVSLKRVGRNLLTTIEVKEGFFYIDCSLVEDTYTSLSSSSDYRFKSIVLNEVDVTSRLTDDPILPE